MLKYLGKRLLRSCLTLLIIATLVFTMLRLMPIEGYFQNYEKMTHAQIDAGLQVLGINDPFPTQLLNFYKNTLRGDFGVSHQYRIGVAVNEIIADKLPISLGIGLAAMVLSLLVGLPLGVIMARSARSKYRISDWLGTAFVVLIQAVPSAIYYLMIQVYGTAWTGLPLLFNVANPASWVLPILSLSLGNIAYYAMWLRRFMADEMGQNYVHLARAKGLSLSAVFQKHVFRNAVVPLVQFIPSSVMVTLMGSIYVESLYSIPGMGGLLVNVIQLQDNTLVQALVLFYAALSILGLLMGDLMMALADPRIHLSEGGAQ